ncbi:MAG: hypothetical protein GX556_11005 [Fibrobacter sp.]|nr:hypothetical protein [Fibrobacter sp.]
MLKSNRHKIESIKQRGLFSELWDSLWLPPSAHCPKCGSAATEYYDPLLFSPIRTLKGKRRIKCTSCKFIWRPSRSGNSIWDRFKPVS